MTKAPRTVSVQAGLMQGPQGELRRAYRATVALVCSQCGAPIPEGSIFARRSRGQGAPMIRPHCQDCLPLRPCERRTPNAERLSMEVPR